MTFLFCQTPQRTSEKATGNQWEPFAGIPKVRSPARRSSYELNSRPEKPHPPTAIGLPGNETAVEKHRKSIVSVQQVAQDAIF